MLRDILIETVFTVSIILCGDINGNSICLEYQENIKLPLPHQMINEESMSKIERACADEVLFMVRSDQFRNIRIQKFHRWLDITCKYKEEVF